MDTARFFDDLTLVPESLSRLADALDTGLPGMEELPAGTRVLLLGMGSSLYAAAPLARSARAQGLSIVAELASAEELPAPSPDLVVIAVSATGSSAEVLHAVERYRGNGQLVAITNKQDSPLATAADVVLPLEAGVEASGIACRTFRHTSLVLREVLRHYGLSGSLPAQLARSAAEANSALFEGRSAWLDEAARLLGDGDGTWTLAPLERLSSAQQSALMMREVPRRLAHACETGDWSHVDVYLTKTLDYRALVFAGSRWDAPALDWMTQRSSTLVAVGAPLEHAALSIRFPGDDDPSVAALSEVMVGELVAETWFRQQ